MKKKIIIVSIVSLFFAIVVCLIFKNYFQDIQEKKTMEESAYQEASIENIIDWTYSDYDICIDRINDHNYFDESNKVVDKDDKIKNLVTNFNYEETNGNDSIFYEYKIYINRDCIYVSFDSKVISKSGIIDGHFNSAKATRYYKISDNDFSLLKYEIEKLYS
jgi:hypothetical protein